MGTIKCIWVWLSLVERLNGVQEAAGSTPVTRTTKKAIAFCNCFFLCDCTLYKATKTFLVKSESVKVKIPKTYAFGILAGVAGFEPTNAAVKVLCLTA